MVKRINDHVAELGPALQTRISEQDMSVALKVLLQVRANVEQLGHDAS
jgi:hypothetical protein